MTNLDKPYQALTANGWTVFNNAWGAGNLTPGKDYTMSASFPGWSNMTDGTVFNWSFPTKSAVPWSQVLGYPEISFGPSPNYNGQDPTDIGHVFPAKVSDITNMTSNYNVSYGGNTKGFDVAYDIWFTNTPNGVGTAAITNEVMIWLHKGDLPAYGQLVGTYSDDNFSGKIYHTGTYTAIISDTDLTDGTVDVAAMIHKLEGLGIISGTEYLSDVEFGAETVLGAGNLTINHFDIDVTTVSSSGISTEKHVGGGGVSLETITGTASKDIITGLGVNDLINGKGGDDKITTGAGNDKVILGLNAGHDEVTDFSVTSDKLEVHYTGIGPVIADKTVNGVSGTLVTAGNSSIFLDNVKASSLTAANFVKVNDTPVEPFHMGINLNGGATGVANALHYSDNSAIDYYAAKGFQDIRLPIDWEKIQPVQGGALDMNYVAQIKDFVAHAAGQGMNVILDIHNYGSGYGNLIGSAGTPISSFADLWGKLATQFAGSSNVEFGLMNEPYQQTAAQWLPAINAAIDAIRDTGATQKILVSGTYWDGGSSWVSSDNDTVIGTPGKIIDPLNNYMIEVHQYLDNGSGQNDWVESTTVGVDRLTAITQWARDNGVKLYLGEFGVADNQPSLTALDNMLHFITANSDVWAGGSYWAGGAGWSWQDYMYSGEPTLGMFDQSQMAILQKYSGAQFATTSLADGSKQVDTTVDGHLTIRDIIGKDGTALSRTLYNDDGSVAKTITFDGTNYTVTTFTENSLAKTIEIYDKSALLAAQPADAFATTRTTIDASGNKIVDHMRDAYNISAEEKYDAAGKLVTTLVNQNGQHISTNYTNGVPTISWIFKDGASGGWVVAKQTNYDANGKVSYITTTLDSGNLQRDFYDATGRMTKTDVLTSDYKLISETLYPITVPTAVSITTQTLVKDTGASTIDKITNDGHVNLSGKVTNNPNTIVKIYDGATVIGTATLDGKGGWAFNAELNAGSHNLKAVVTDVTGAALSTATQSAIVVDKTAPNVDLTSLSKEGNVTVIKGTAEVGSSVKIMDGTALLGTVSANSKGQFEYRTVLANGAHDVKALASDAAGNQGQSGDIVLKTGPDKMVINVSEDAYKGDAQFTIKIDGVQQAGVYTATALHNANQSQDVVLYGNFGAGSHTVAVNYINDAYGGVSGLDRNLYVNSIAINDSKESFGNNQYQGGVAEYKVTAPTLDKLVLNISEDAYKGDAQFTVKVDGVQVGGTYTATALHNANDSQEFTLYGYFGAKDHTVSVNFVNDAYTAGVGDRNLHVNSIAFNDVATTYNKTQASNGSVDYHAAPVMKDTLILKVSEDAYNGNAQFIVKVDGHQVGDTYTATALHKLGQSDEFVIKGNFGDGNHTVSVNFINDAYNGTSATDRNLYVESVQLNDALTNIHSGQFKNGDVSYAATNYADNDRLDLHNLLDFSHEDVTTQNIYSFLKATQVGADTVISVDKDGAANGAHFVDAVVLSGHDHVDLSAMLQQGHLVA